MYIPTTAIALLALQDRPDHDAVKKSLAHLSAHCLDERSGLSLSLGRIGLVVCTDVPGGNVLADIDAALTETWGTTRYLGNCAATALACTRNWELQTVMPLSGSDSADSQVGQGFSASRLTRRQFLSGCCRDCSSPEGLWLPTLPSMERSRFARSPPISDVLLLAAASYDADISGAIGRGLRELGFSLAGKRVLLKPNMVEYSAVR